MKRRFADLLRPIPGLSPSEQQRLAHEQLREIVNQSSMHYFNLGDEVVNQGIRVLLGVATYCIADMRLLDALNDLHSTVSPLARIDVFSVQDAEKPEDLERYIPTIGHRFDVPLVGIWNDAMIKESAWGAAARDLLTQYFPSLSRVEFFDLPH